MSFRIAQLLVSVLSIFDLVTCANILLTTMPQGRSHALTYMPLMHRLVDDGHQVTVYFEIFKPEIPLGGGVVENMLLLEGEAKTADSDPVFQDVLWNGKMDAWTLMIPFVQSARTCQMAQENRAEDFWKLANRTWDVVLVDPLFTPCGYAIALRNKRPYIIMNSGEILPMFAYLNGYARNYGILPKGFFEYENPSYDNRKFSDRLTSVWQLIELNAVIFGPTNLILKWATADIADFNMITFFPGAAFDFYDLPTQISWPSPANNELHSYGAHCKPSKVLDGKFKKFISDPKSKGTILMALGTICRWDMAPKRIVDAFVNAFNQLTDYRIVWAYKGPKLPLKSHVITKAWVPQIEILNDPSTRLFISHGGLKSVKEAICSEMPVVYMPMFAEQLRNAFLARELHFAEYVNKNNLTAEYLLETMRQVLIDDSYKTAVKRARSLMLDLPMPAIDKASFHFRKLLQYGGRLPEFVYRKVLLLSSISYYYIDLLAVSFALLVFTSKN